MDQQVQMDQQIQWNEQDVADAFMELGLLNNVTIVPQTALDLAADIRSKCQKGDRLEFKCHVKEVINDLSLNPETIKTTAALSDLMNVIAKRIEGFLKRAEPISPEEEEELKAGVLNDVIIPLQDGISDAVADATRKTLRELVPLQREQNELEEYIKEGYDRINQLSETWKNNPNDRRAEKAYKYEKNNLETKKRKSDTLQNDINVKQSHLIILDRASTYVKKKLVIPDRFGGYDGMSEYFENVLNPIIKNVKDSIMQIRRGIVLPEISEKERHRREWILRHHHTTSYQDAKIGPSIDTVTMDDIRKSPVFDQLVKEAVPENRIERSVNELNELPNTWRKGHAIYMLLDPPAQKTINKDLPTLMEQPIDMKDKERTKNWDPTAITSQPFSIEKGQLEDKSIADELIKSTKPRATSPERKLAEALNPKAHWSILFNLSRNQKVGKDGLTRAERYVQSTPENMRDNEEVQERAKKMDDEDMLNDREIILGALMNPSIPDWVLMRAAVIGYSTDIRRIAKAILTRKRGWNVSLDEDGNPKVDQKTHDFIWEKESSFTGTASVDRLSVLAQATDQQYSQQSQQKQDQINGVDQQIKTMTQQIQQLQTQKTDLEKQKNSIPKPSTVQPATTTPAATPSASSPSAPAPMSGPTPFTSALSSREIRLGQDLSTELEMQEDQPSEGDFVYDNASSGLSVHGDKYLGKFIEWDAVVKAINEYAHKHKWYPNIWQVSDHGNWHQVMDFKYTETPAVNPNAIEKPFYQKMRDRF